MSHIREVPGAWDEFLKLEDTPALADYSTVDGQFVRANDGAGALEFTDDVLQLSGGTMTGDLVLAGDPDSDLKAATKQYVDNQITAAAQGLDVKDSVKAATTANTALSGELTIDGVSLSSGDRILVKNQSTGSENGIYVVAAGAWSRAADADSDAEVTAGLFTFVEEGTVNADTGWVLTTDDPIVVGTTAQTYTQFSGAGTYTAGAGLDLTGGEFSVVFEDDDGDIEDIGTASAGVLNTVARADHVHAHGDQAGGSLHADAVAGVSSGFMSAADKTKLDGLNNPSSGSVTGQTLYWDGSSWEPSSVLFNAHGDTEVGINTASPVATLDVNGSFALATTTQTGDYVMNTGTNMDVGTILHNNTAADQQITLPTPAEGLTYHIKKISGPTYKTTVATAGAETIDGAATYELDRQYESITVVCDGTNWHIV